jgi:hypothetical protein
MLLTTLLDLTTEPPRLTPPLPLLILATLRNNSSGPINIIPSAMSPYRRTVTHHFKGSTYVDTGHPVQKILGIVPTPP